MKMLINDVLQGQNAVINVGSNNIKTPALIETSPDTSFDFSFDETSLNCIGIANVRQLSGIIGTVFTVQLYDTGGPLTPFVVSGFGIFNDYRIFYFDQTYNNIIRAVITFAVGGTWAIGRIALGMYRDIPIFKRREPGFSSTTRNRKTSGGQKVGNLAGVAYRMVGFEWKLKINEDVFNDFDNGRHHLARGFPFFIEFTDEYQKWIPWQWFYADDQDGLMFQSAVKRFLYSKKFTLEECK